METRYDSIKVSADGMARIELLKNKAEILATWLDDFPGRASSIALTHLQTAVMFGVRAISENFSDDE